MANVEHPRRKVESVVSREMDGELLILDQANEQIHQLNATAAEVWRLCDGNHSRQDIAGVLSQQYAIPLERAAGDVETVLGELERLQLIEHR